MPYIYNPFPLDSWIARLYKSLGIYTPKDINEHKIANQLKIHLSYSERRCYARDEGRFKLINLNKNIQPHEQREIFFHELYHILRHSGYQYQYKSMPHSFRELQEWDAAHFTRYAAIPFHMLKYIDFKSPYLIETMSNTFKVSEELCEYRVDHIFRNMKPYEKRGVTIE